MRVSFGVIANYFDKVSHNMANCFWVICELLFAKRPVFRWFANHFLVVISKFLLILGTIFVYDLQLRITLSKYVAILQKLRITFRFWYPALIYTHIYIHVYIDTHTHTHTRTHTHTHTHTNTHIYIYSLYIYIYTLKKVQADISWTLQAWIFRLKFVSANRTFRLEYYASLERSCARRWFHFRQVRGHTPEMFRARFRQFHLSAVRTNYNHWTIKAHQCTFALYNIKS